MIKALLLDMDGVLLDSSSVHANAFAETLDEFGIDFSFDYSSMSGKSTKEVFQSIVKQLNLNQDLVKKLTTRKQELAMSNFQKQNKPPLFPGVEDSLERLSKIFMLSLCTSASYKTVEFFFNSNIDRGIFDAILTSDDIENSKPSPEIYTRAMAKLNLDSNDCLVVEDSVAGIVAGVSANAQVSFIGTRQYYDAHIQKLGKNIRQFATFEEFTNSTLSSL